MLRQILVNHLWWVVLLVGSVLLLTNVWEHAEAPENRYSTVLEVYLGNEETPASDDVNVSLRGPYALDPVPLGGGRFGLNQQPDGDRYRVVAIAPGYLERTVPLELGRQRIVLTRGTTVRFQLRGTDGTIPPAPVIRAYRNLPSFSFEYDTASGRTSVHGLPNNEEVPLRIAYSRDEKPESVTIDTTPVTGHGYPIVVVGHSGVWTGLILDERGEPIRTGAAQLGFGRTPTPLNQVAEDGRWTPSTGRFRIRQDGRGLQEQAELRIDVPGYYHESFRRYLQPGETHTQTIRLVPLDRSLTVHAVDTLTGGPAETNAFVFNRYSQAVDVTFLQSTAQFDRLPHQGWVRVFGDFVPIEGRSEISIEGPKERGPYTEAGWRYLRFVDEQGEQWSPRGIDRDLEATSSGLFRFRDRGIEMPFQRRLGSFEGIEYKLISRRRNSPEEPYTVVVPRTHPTLEWAGVEGIDAHGLPTVQIKRIREADVDGGVSARFRLEEPPPSATYPVPIGDVEIALLVSSSPFDMPRYLHHERQTIAAGDALSRRFDVPQGSLRVVDARGLLRDSWRHWPSFQPDPSWSRVSIEEGMAAYSSWSLVREPESGAPAEPSDSVAEYGKGPIEIPLLDHGRYRFNTQVAHDRSGNPDFLSRAFEVGDGPVDLAMTPDTLPRIDPILHIDEGVELERLDPEIRFVASRSGPDFEANRLSIFDDVTYHAHNGQRFSGLPRGHYVMVVRDRHDRVLDIQSHYLEPDITRLTVRARPLAPIRYRAATTHLARPELYAEDEWGNWIPLFEAAHFVATEEPTTIATVPPGRYRVDGHIIEVGPDGGDVVLD